MNLDALSQHRGAHPQAETIYRWDACLQRLRTRAQIAGFLHDGCPAAVQGTWHGPTPVPVAFHRERAYKLLGEAAGHFLRLSGESRKVVKKVRSRLVEDEGYYPDSVDLGLLLVAADERLQRAERGQAMHWADETVNGLGFFDAKCGSTGTLLTLVEGQVTCKRCMKALGIRRVKVKGDA